MTIGMIALKVIVLLVAALLISCASKYPINEERIYFSIGYALILLAAFAK